MAAFDSYTSLKSTISSYLARADLDSMIPAFISLAELRLGRDLRIRQMLKVVTTNTVAGDSTVQLPDDFSMMRDLHINTNPVAVVSYDTPSLFYRNAKTSTTGQPKFYTILANEFQFSPVPDAAYELQMLYYCQPHALSDTNATNIFLTTCPDLLLYASLAEAEPYLMNDPRLATWQALYDRGLTSLTVQDDAGEYSGTPLAITVATR